MIDKTKTENSQFSSVPLLDLKAQYATIHHELQAAIDRVVESQQFILGPEVEALEHEVATYTQCKYGIGVSSGTDALLISLMATGIKPGDEVITTPYSFIASAGAIVRVGAIPVFVDIDPLTYNIDPHKIESAITEHTRAIIPVHLYGQMADMDPIVALADRYKLYVVEDAAQAIGAEYKGRRAGSLGHLGCFSFFPSKNLGGFGDGGMVVTDDPGLANRVRQLRHHGYDPVSKSMGGNFRLDGIQAAVLRVKLNYLDAWTVARQRNADTYHSLFAEAGVIVPPESLPCLHDSCHATSLTCNLQSTKMIVLPSKSPSCRHVYNQFVIRTSLRDDLIAFLKKRLISTKIYYPVPMHLEECFVGLGYQVGSFPCSECASRETLALPIYPELTKQMLKAVVETIADFYAAI